MRRSQKQEPNSAYYGTKGSGGHTDSKDYLGYHTSFCNLLSGQVAPRMRFDPRSANEFARKRHVSKGETLSP